MKDVVPPQFTRNGVSQGQAPVVPPGAGPRGASLGAVLLTFLLQLGTIH